MATEEFDTVNQEILAETKKLAGGYRAKFVDDPQSELRAWLQIAARREAMVSDVYGFAERTYRLPEPRGPAADVAWDALTLIWQQEVVHTKFIEVRLKEGLLEQGTLTAEMMLWLGKTEGEFLGALTSRPSLRHVLARLAIRLGALFTPDKVPGFTLELAEMDPREFFVLCAVLETTARQAYQRMEDLAEMLADKLSHDGPRSLQMENFSRELHLKLLDETFHEAAFQEMAGWFTDGKLDPKLDPRTCAQRLSELLPRSGKDLGNPDSPLVITDGGLGKLFNERGISVTVVGI